jgi:hypothetical protein
MGIAGSWHAGYARLMSGRFRQQIEAPAYGQPAVTSFRTPYGEFISAADWTAGGEHD